MSSKVVKNIWLLQASPEFDYGEMLVQIDARGKPVLQMGIGRKPISPFRVRKLLHKAMNFLALQRASVAPSENLASVLGIEDGLMRATLILAAHRNDGLRSSKLPRPNLELVTQGLNEFEQIMISAQMLAIKMVDTPANLLSPSKLERRIATLATDDLAINTYQSAECRKLGLGALTAVGQASTEAPRLIEIVYTPRKNRKKKPVALVGKGITFDTGGLCLKPNNYMYGMKSDMAGAATVIAIIYAAQQLQLPVPLVGIIPTAENSIGATSYRPGDILKAMNGKTIEIVDTDAEGRLALADALSFVSRHSEVETIIDFATLTGSCVSALGTVAAGAFCEDANLLTNYSLASEQAGEPIWPLPMYAEYAEDLQSDVADVLQCANRPDASLAAMFLKEFVPQGKRWLHLDIAGTAFLDEEDDYHRSGATGRHIRSTITFLQKN